MIRNSQIITVHVQFQFNFGEYIIIILNLGGRK